MTTTDIKTIFSPVLLGDSEHIDSKKNDPVTVIADDCERKSKVISSLMDMKGVTVSTQRLSIGDYQVDNRLLFERKTLHDFAISIIDGRLFKQMFRLANSNPNLAKPEPN